MRRTLPLALLLTACSKPTTPPVAVSPPPAQKVVPTDITPEAMAEAMDVPTYPGVEAPEGMSSIPAKRPDGSTHYSLVLATKDPVDKVAGWYTKRLGLAAMPGMGGQTIIGSSKKGNDLLVTIAPEAGRTLIRLKSIAYAK